MSLVRKAVVTAKDMGECTSSRFDSINVLKLPSALCAVAVAKLPRSTNQTPELSHASRKLQWGKVLSLPVASPMAGKKSHPWTSKPYYMFTSLNIIRSLCE